MDTRETVMVAGTPDGVRAAAEAFDAFVDAHGLPASARWRFQVALDEVLSNIVKAHAEAQSKRHAEPPSAEEAPRMDLLLDLSAAVLSVSVIDRGIAFDPLQAPAPDMTAALDDRRPGGLGIMLVRALMDDVRYERRDEQNYLTMIWRVRADDEPSPAAGTGPIG